MVTINLFATYRLETGTKSFQLNNPRGMTIAGGIKAVLEKYPVLKKHWINSDGELFPHVVIIHNGIELSRLDNGLETNIQDGDELGFFPPLSGG
jgi:molybdopterin synthase sulfur carrier subunit